MHRVDTDGHVSNLFNEGDPLVPRNPTQVDKHWLNAMQEEIASLIVARGVSLVKGTNTQLATALATVTRVDDSASLANSWTAGSPQGPKHYITSAGMVCLEGTITHATDGINLTAFTLPAGARPPFNYIFPVALTSGDGSEPYIEVQAGGNVLVKDSSGASVSGRTIRLNGINFHP